MYPTIEQVEAADQLQLCKWYRFLHSPGSKAVNESTEAFRKVMDYEKPIMDRIVDRVKEGDGFTPEISKKIGEIDD